MKKSYFKRIMVSIIIICTVFCFTSISTVKAAGNSDAMGVGNNYPIVMVHGCFGWGSNEGAGLYYWGGKESLTQKLTEKGYTVYSPSIGPVSSNWDRACELYTYIVGGTVDYGESHSKNMDMKDMDEVIQACTNKLEQKIHLEMFKKFI